MFQAFGSLGSSAENSISAKNGELMKMQTADTAASHCSMKMPWRPGQSGQSTKQSGWIRSTDRPGGEGNWERGGRGYYKTNNIIVSLLRTGLKIIWGILTCFTDLVFMVEQPSLNLLCGLLLKTPTIMKLYSFRQLLDGSVLSSTSEHWGFAKLELWKGWVTGPINDFPSLFREYSMRNQFSEVRQVKEAL